MRRKGKEKSDKKIWKRKYDKEGRRESMVKKGEEKV